MTSRLPCIWVVDELDIVHTHRCRGIEGESADYFPAARGVPNMPGHTPEPRTAHNLIEHLARPDRHESHQGTGILVHCEDCIGAMAEIESAR